MEKVILVIIDGLSYGTKKYMGFLEALKSENLTDSYNCLLYTSPSPRD